VKYWRENMNKMWAELPDLKLNYKTLPRGEMNDVEPNKYGLQNTHVGDEYMAYLRRTLYTKIENAFVGTFYKNSWFNWHKDGRRTCAINVLLTPEDENAYCEMICPDTNEVHRVPYRQNIPMLFNATNIHRVMNTTDKDRKILSISFYDKANDGSGFVFDELLMLYDKGLMINETDIYQV
jgi:hypothetical protein